MITKEQLGQLSSDEKNALILEQARRIEMHEARISELEALLKGLHKTSKNSSKPPSQDRKANLLKRLKLRGKKRKGHKGVARELHLSPDEILESKLKNCQSCDHPFEEGDHQLQNEYDKIEIPPIKAKVTRVRLYRGCCQACGASAVAPAPQGLSISTGARPRPSLSLNPNGGSRREAQAKISQESRSPVYVPR